MKKTLLFLIVLSAAYYAYDQYEPAIAQPQQEVGHSQQEVVRWHSGQQVQGTGMVLRVLPDDNDGSRHQRFILELSSGQTLLIVHNIDLAPRIPSLSSGDSVSFYGQYESNPQGGVIHWTHRDPQGRHTAGWLEHNGRRYQ
jgi:hypothetical protein